MAAPAPVRVKQGIEVYHYVDDGEAVVMFWKGDHHWLVAEDSYYEPMPDHKIGPSLDDQREPGHPLGFPFHTSGEQLTFNVTLGQAMVRDIDYEEGQVQGLVYALSELLHGAESQAGFYADYIRDRLIPEDFAERSHPLSPVVGEAALLLASQGTMPFALVLN